MKTVLQYLITESTDNREIDSIATALFMPRDTEENEIRQQLTLDNSVGYVRQQMNVKEKNENEK